MIPWALGREAASGENVVDQESVNAPVSIFERVHEHEAVGDDGRMNDRMDRVRVHPLVRDEHALHERGEVRGLGGYEMDPLALP
jgi:hypothetical protein